MGVKRLEYNFRQTGSLNDREGAGCCFEAYTVGSDNVVKIEEFRPCNGMELWNFLIHFKDGSKVRVFNPNKVYYSKS